ncbi:MAG: UDP-glucose 4-epimerase GalE [Ruminococcus bromii]|nr:UDP-glucose 4-epimerase GalE [Ruminococcus bromii]MCI7211648.1 UDP-glucose 4-epimerase GalE [Ruminococcus bromii]MDD6433063.1 UDP-glucose 4-epimerase GalE [Ruminococcus bromii]MDY4084160.1 UDP-glucose 4-epimerase GalE [Ruminococcus bromii]MDY4711052.1 UDP-glucose 4-epimerase GalE [Ruminococcus bromii]
MNVLLAGGAGYIGSHTCVELLNAGHDVIVADNFSNSCPEAIKRVEEITGKKVPLYEADVCEKEAVDKIFAENKIDAVIHFAGLKAVGESCEKPVMYYRNNIDSTLTLLEAMKKYGVNNFIFSSSATVYGTPKTVPLVETMPTGSPTNPYGWTKLMMEQILTDTAKANPEMSVVLLRYFNPIGAHESGRIGEDPNGIPNNLMPYITQVAAGRLPQLGVFGDDYPTHDGTGVRDYIHVVDLAKGHVKAIEYSANHKGTEVFNLGTGSGYSVLDIVKAFIKVNKIDIPYVIKPRRAGDIAECYADASKAEKILGWKAEKNLEDMCYDSWNWQSHNVNGYK